jgi:acyl-ACP thioesterase
MSIATDSKFDFIFPLRYQDTDRQLRVRLSALFSAMQESTILQAEKVGCGLRWLNERNMGWILVQTRAKIHHLPCWPANIKVTTWPSDMGRLLSRREFVIRDDQNNKILDATSLWAFVDTNTRRPTRVPSKVHGVYQESAERALELPFGRPCRLEQPDTITDFSIRHQDIDFYDHVNNLRYLQWIIESIPADIVDSWKIAELNIRFQKETTLPGSVIRVKTQEVEENSSQIKLFSHELSQPDACSEIVLAQTIWQT